MQSVCEICGYVHDEDDQPLDICPLCLAPKSKFVEYKEEN